MPPLPKAVVAASEHYDLLCHQYDVVPRLFGRGKGAATADALRLRLPGGGATGSPTARDGAEPADGALGGDPNAT